MLREIQAYEVYIKKKKSNKFSWTLQRNLCEHKKKKKK